MKQNVMTIAVCLIANLFFISCDKSSSKHPLEPPDDNTQTPGVPTFLNSGEYGISGQEYTLNWTSVNNASSYILQEATQITFEDSVSTVVADTTLSITKEAQSKRQFYYRLRAVNEELYSAWSDTLNVDVYPIVMPRPVLRGPDGTIGSGDMYTLQWTNTGDSYTLEESPTIIFSHVVSYSVSDTSNVLYHTKSEGTIFCYRVKANGVPGVYDSQWSNSITVVVVGKIAFTSDRDGNSEIYVMNEDGTNQRNLSNNPASDTHPSWSPDGNQLIFVRDNINICSMNADGTNQQSLVNFNIFPWSLNLFDSITKPSWSPDGLQILFSGYIRVYTQPYDFPNRFYLNPEIFVYRADGPYIDQLTKIKGEDTHPCWSPTGMEIAFASNTTGYYEIYKMNANGTALRNLSNMTTTHDDYPSWSPDGTQIVFQKFMAGGIGYWEIFVMNVDGSNQINLTNSSYAEIEPSWSSDGKEIAFSSRRFGNLAIVVMNADGTNQRF